jgi:hypothetical protein
VFIGNDVEGGAVLRASAAMGDVKRIALAASASPAQADAVLELAEFESSLRVTLASSVLLCFDFLERRSSLIRSSSSVM